MIPEDPYLLVSYVNMKLRDYYPSFTAMCDDLDISEQEVMQKLAGIGYHYQNQMNQFIQQ